MAGDIAQARRAAGLDFTEAELQAAVTDAARTLGYLVYHTRDSRGSEAGFPDLVLLRKPRWDGEGGRLVFAELKSRTGRLSASQKAWLEALEMLGLDPQAYLVEAYLWTPDDWPERIVGILRGPRTVDHQQGGAG